MCYRRLNAAAVGDRCLTRAAKASRPFGGSRHLPLALTEGARSHPGEDYCSWLSVAFTCPKLESWSGEAQLTEPISQRTEELSYTLVSYLKLFNVFNPTLHTLGVSLNELNASSQPFLKEFTGDLIVCRCF